MEIMSTNVTNTTRYRGKYTKYTIYLGVDFQKVYIIYQKKIVEKLGKHGQEYKRLDFFKIFVIMATTREIEMYLNVTI